MLEEKEMNQKRNIRANPRKSKLKMTKEGVIKSRKEGITLRIWKKMNLKYSFKNFKA